MDKENSYILKIVDNKNKSVADKQVKEMDYTFSEMLKPGLYYWKIELNGKLEAVGKFYIR